MSRSMTGIEMEDVACPLGCPKDDEPVLAGRDLLHELPGIFAVVRCRTCGLMRTNPRPTRATIGGYYPEDYGPYRGTRVTATTSGPRRLSSLRNAVKEVLELNTMRLPAVRPGRMLEIGCASGAFLHAMANRGWQVEGIEASASAAACAAALGYRVHTGTVEDAPAPAEPLDLIVGWMVLEHLHEPVQALRRLASWLNPSGWLVLSTPNAGAIDFRIFGSNWYPLQLPTHLYHLTPKSVARMLAAAGWRLERVHFQRVLVDPVASLGYVLAARGMSSLGPRLVRFTEAPWYWAYALLPFAAVAAAFGQTSRMTLWARKAS
jgi:2-polyprenyl-3-methyl-5-hydroxy-6-metoxy-1,4-benzoquinol methylase